jgi:predicted GIY-YIG superfamily endonuclease
VVRRVAEHRDPGFKGFTRRYNVSKLDSLAAIAREKQIKGGSRARKIA